jgi:hypothetical protein
MLSHWLQGTVKISAWGPVLKTHSTCCLYPPKVTLKHSFFFFSVLNFILEFTCINDTRRSHCDNSCMRTVCFEQVHPSVIFPSPLPSPLLQTVLGGFHYAVFTFIHEAYFSTLYPSVSFSFLPPPADLLVPTAPHLHSCPMSIIVGVCSTDKWDHAVSGFLSLTYLA